jgi:hypothetical protein
MAGAASSYRNRWPHSRLVRGFESRQVHLSRQFENFSPAAKTLVRRLARGVYCEDRRPVEPRIRDDRGPLVRSIGKAQTFLGAAQVDELAAMYVVGATVRDVAEHFRVHHTTVLAYLKRRAVPLRRRGLDPADIADAD